MRQSDARGSTTVMLMVKKVDKDDIEEKVVTVTK